ncbi:MAG: murein biosynthesis integral membrane protein MurJ [Caldilineaceae bacterium]|nr:murein biosynthesis integral membrane protein MurJ [Caldilineaceae bacterium]
MSSHPRDAAATGGAPESRGATARNAGLLAAGSLAGRALGLVREITITRLFGQSGRVSAFVVASQIPVMLHDLIVGGYVSAAFVPVLAARLEDDGRPGYGRLVSALLFAFGLILLGVATLMLWFADPIARIMAGGFARFSPELLDETAAMVRWMTPVLWLIGMSGVLNSVLFAMDRFGWPAVANATVNVGIIAIAPLWAREHGVMALVWGLWAGHALQALILAADLKRAVLRLFGNVFDPGLRQLFRRYLPIIASLVVSQVQVLTDRRFASGTGLSSIAWMRTATTLQQLPLGLISFSIGLATLPGLARSHAGARGSEFRSRTVASLGQVLLWMTPVLICMALLAEPVVRLLFERGAFTEVDTASVLPAVRIYLIGAFCAASDQLLNNAFYARQNTLVPALVGMGSVLAYFAAAFLLLDGMGYLGLVWADTAKHAVHMIVMLILVGRRGFGAWHGLAVELAPLAWRLAIGGSLCLAAVVLVRWAVGAAMSPSAGHDLVDIALAGGVGFAVYFGCLLVLRTTELVELAQYVKSRLPWLRSGP